VYMPAQSKEIMSHILG